MPGHANTFNQFNNGKLNTGQNQLSVSKDSIRRNREMAQMLLNNVQQRRQIQSPTQGLALLANALNARNFRKKADAGEAALKKQDAQKLGALLDGLNLDPEQRALMENSSPGIQQALIAKSLDRNLFPEVKKPPTPQDAVNFGTLDGQVTLTAVKGTPEFDQAVANPDLVRIGNVSQVQRTEDVTPTGDRTQTQRGKDEQDFLNQIGSVISVSQTANELFKTAVDNPAAIGNPGGIARIGNNMLQTAKAVASFAGVEFETPDIDGFDFSSFRNTAIENSVYRSGMFNIAVAAVAAEQGGKISDNDIQLKLDELGANSSDPKALQRTLGSYVNRANRNVRTFGKLRGIDQSILDRSFGLLDESLGVFGPEGNVDTTSPDVEALIKSGLSPTDAEELIQRRRQSVGQ